MSSHLSGKKMTRYDLPTTEAALAACERELASELGDAIEYAFVYDALLKSGDRTAPALVFHLVERRLLLAGYFLYGPVAEVNLPPTEASKASELFIIKICPLVRDVDL